MGLYLTCGICGRKQADGLLSRGLWGHVESVQRGTLRVCPTCKERHADWQTVALSSTAESDGDSQEAAGVLG